MPYIKRVKFDKLTTRLDTVEEYDDLFTAGEVEELLREVPSYYIDPERCKACGTCRRQCPVEAIDGGKNLIHVIDQDAVHQVRDLLQRVSASLQRGGQAASASRCRLPSRRSSGRPPGSW